MSLCSQAHGVPIAACTLSMENVQVSEEMYPLNQRGSKKQIIGSLSFACFISDSQYCQMGPRMNLGAKFIFIAHIY